jgi:hypothetical protein
MVARDLASFSRILEFISSIVSLLSSPSSSSLIRIFWIFLESSVAKESNKSHKKRTPFDVKKPQSQLEVVEEAIQEEILVLLDLGMDHQSRACA